MEKLQIGIILEILGRPKENVKEALNNLVAKLGSESGIKILEKTLHEPKPVKDSKDLFTAFADILLELDSLNNYFGILFAYMPSHVEIIHPEKIHLSNFDFNDIGNKLVLRLHDYDAITKKAIYEREILLKKLQEVAPHLFKQQAQKQAENTTAQKSKAKKSHKKSQKKKSS